MKPRQVSTRRDSAPASSRALFVAIALALASGMAAAASPMTFTDASFMDIDAMVLAAKGRPNEEYRLHGLKAYKQGNYPDAMKRFEVAAYHADKYSQHFLSLMHWHGIGLPPDHVQGYIWSDLAAERGSKRMLAIREKMWAELTPAQQAQVEARGTEFYARYGDAVAKPRVESEIRAFARDMTGSRVGYRNQRMDVMVGPPSGSFSGPGSRNQLSQPPSADELYGKEGGLRALTTYWKEQDRLLDGSVDVGPVQTVRRPASPGGN